MKQYIGIDFHKQFSQVAVLDHQGTIMDEQKIFHDQQEELANYFSQFGQDTSVAIESTRGWYWLVDMLQDYGLKVKLVHAKKVRIIAESTIKTDKIDAEVLAHLDRCNFLPQAYIANKQVRQERELLRYHLSLIKVQTAVKNRIHALLSKHNIHHGFSDLFGKSGVSFLRKLSLPGVFQFELLGYLSLLESIMELLKNAHKQIDKHCRAWPEAELLTTVPGIGKLSGLLLAAEIADIQRFSSAKKLSCYAGLAPSTHQSANREYLGAIIKDSNAYIRYVLLEAVPHVIKHDPKLRSFYNKIWRAKGFGKAKIATAHKLIIAIYYMLKNKEAYCFAHNKNLPQVNPLSGLGAITATH